jgi:hypothetical protein
VRKIEAELGGSDQGALLVDVIAQGFTKRIVEDVSSGMIVAKRPSAKFVIRGDNWAANVEFAVFENTGVYNISVVDLDVADLKVGDAVNDNVTSIILLSTRLGVEARLVKDDTKGGACRDLAGIFVELFVVYNDLNLGVNVAST